MEVRSVVCASDANSTLTQDTDKAQNMDAFSELLAMLFNNMLIPGSNQYSFSMNQDNTTDLSNTSKKNTELNQMLSILDNLRISGGQLKDTESIQGLLNSNGNSLLGSVLSNNTDFQKLLGLTDNVTGELQEFINNINGLGSKEAESIGTKLSNAIVDIIPEELDKNMITSNAKTISDILNIQTDENTTVSELKKISDILNTQTRENTTVSELKKVSDIINMQRATIETEKAPNNSSDANVKGINVVIETSADDTNNSANTQGEAKSIKPEGKTIVSIEPANNFDQAFGLNNLKNESMNNVTQQPKVSESALIERPQDIIDITVEKFKTLKLPGSTEVTVKLRPEELGEVSLKLILEKGQINGSITAQRKEVVFMLQNNLDQLKTDLKSNNVNLNNITVNIQAGEDFDSNKSRRGFNSKQNRSNHRVVQAFEEEMQSYDLPEGFNIIA